MDDLVAFLGARFDEDEQAAQAAGNRRWLVQDNIIELYPEREDDGFMSWPTRGDARHAANWEPARVLREVEANRLILNAHAQVPGHGGVPICKECSHGPDEYYQVEWPCLTTRLLALPHADHEDYREEWRP